LQDTAKKNDYAWLTLKVIGVGKTTVPQIIDSSLESLRTVIVTSFSLCYGPSSDRDRELQLRKAGDETADALLSARVVLQLIYTRRLDWERESQILKQGTMDCQIEVRQGAKVRPLPTLFTVKN
jgi:hypothetical protein